MIFFIIKQLQFSQFIVNEKLYFTNAFGVTLGTLADLIITGIAAILLFNY
jgi:hypothetical protein